jgi:hypothetical protein
MLCLLSIRWHPSPSSSNWPIRSIDRLIRRLAGSPVRSPSLDFNGQLAHRHESGDFRPRSLTRDSLASMEVRVVSSCAVVCCAVVCMSSCLDDLHIVACAGLLVGGGGVGWVAVNGAAEEL